MTQAWDAARAASKRSIRKPYKPVAPIAMPVERLQSRSGYRIDGVEMGYAEWALDTKCGACGFNVCACDTNRKFSFHEQTGARALKVGDVLIGKCTELRTHDDQVIIVAEIDVRMGDEKGGRLGIRAWSGFGADKPSTWRYGYLREEFVLTTFGACHKHHTCWDTENPDIPHECVHCKNEVTLTLPVMLTRPMFQAEAVKPEDAETAKQATAVVNHLMDGIDPEKLKRDMDAMMGFAPNTGKQITATPEQAKFLEVPYQATIPIGRNYRFPVEKNPISDFKDFGNHADEPMEQWSLEQLKTRMDEIMDQVVKHMTNGPHK